MTDGCDVCDMFKQKLAVNNEQGVEAYSLAKQGAGIIGTLLNRLEHDINNHELHTFHPGWAKDASTLTRALASLMNEIRKYEESAAGKASKFSFGEKLDGLMQWLYTLPPRHQAEVADRISEYLNGTGAKLINLSAG